ncbi:hypothetical protein AGLY_018289, partial [Aphis glycines]
ITILHNIHLNQCIKFKNNGRRKDISSYLTLFLYEYIKIEIPYQLSKLYVLLYYTIFIRTNCNNCNKFKNNRRRKDISSYITLSLYEYIKIEIPYQLSKLYVLLYYTIFIRTNCNNCNKFKNNRRRKDISSYITLSLYEYIKIEIPYQLSKLYVLLYYTIFIRTNCNNCNKFKNNRRRKDISSYITLSLYEYIKIEIPYQLSKLYVTITILHNTHLNQCIKFKNNGRRKDISSYLTLSLYEYIKIEIPYQLSKLYVLLYYTIFI